MPRRPTLHFASRALLGALLALLTLEVALQLVEATPLWRILPVVEPILGQPDRDIGYAFTPGIEGTWVRENRARVRINSLGLRGPEIERMKPAGTRRIGLTGDSMVEALQVGNDETFAALAERELRRRGNAVEVVNLAMSGNGPLRQLVRLEKFGLPLGLDLVVMYSSAGDFVSGELLQDAANPGYVRSPAGSMERSHAFRNRWQVRHIDTQAGRAFMAVLQHSAVVRMVYLRTREPVPQLLGLPGAPAVRKAPAICGADRLAAFAQLWLEHQPADQWAATAKFVDELAAATSARGLPATYLMADIPMPAGSCAAERGLRARLLDTINHEFAARRVRFVDWDAALLARIGSADDGSARLSPLHGFGRDVNAGHLNYWGHLVFAEALVDVVVASNGELSDGSRRKQGTAGLGIAEGVSKRHPDRGALQ